MVKNSDFTEFSSTKYRRILISRFSALGDVAMTIPVVYSICVANPDTKFMMLTDRVAASLFVNAPANLLVKGINKSEYKGVVGLHRLYREIKNEFSPDAYVDLHGVLRTHILSLFFRLSGVKVSSIDKGRSGKRALTRASNKRMFPLISSRARYREAFYRIGFPCDDIFSSIFGGKPADLSEFSDISTAISRKDTLIAVAPFAKHKGKIYPLPLMEKVIEKLNARPDYKIFLLGSGEYEQEILQAWENKFNHAISLAGKRYGFRKELALLSNCSAMISMDSANMHLSSLVNLPVISIWGATHPYCGFMGWKQKEENAVQLNMACRPCSVFGNKPCLTGDYFCLNGIQPDMIIAALDRELNQQKK